MNASLGLLGDDAAPGEARQEPGPPKWKGATRPHNRSATLRVARQELGPSRIRREEGFTLIEIMVVVVIIGLLLTVVASNIIPNLRKADIVKSRADVQGLETALDTYRLDNGFYPTTEQGLDALLHKPTSEPAPYNWNGPYLKGHSTVPKDRWGHEYLYLNPGVHNPDGYDVWTRGADGQEGGEGPNADIGNWQQEEAPGSQRAASSP
jgi:general secretion pathway protein G